MRPAVLTKASRVDRHLVSRARLGAGGDDDRRHMVDIRVTLNGGSISALHFNRLFASLLVGIAVLLEARNAVGHLRTPEACEQGARCETAEGHHSRVQFLSKLVSAIVLYIFAGDLSGPKRLTHQITVRSENASLKRK